MSSQTAGAAVYLALGSNLSDRPAAMRGAVFALDRHSGIHVDRAAGVASLYESAPLTHPSDAKDQPPYLNSVVRVETTLEPAGLLAALQEIEASMGRVRRKRWEPRIIDIDMLLYNELITHDRCLTLPHPRMHERRFVLEPLAEIAAEVIHPTLGATMASLARELADSGRGGDLTRIAGPDWLDHAPAHR